MAMGRCLMSCVTVVFLLFSTAAAEEPARKNRLDFAEGTVVLSATDRLNDRWHPLYLIDGNNETGWCSAKGKTLRNELLFEMNRDYRIEEFVLDTMGTEEKAHPNCSARSFEVWTSKTSSEKGYSKALVAKAARSAKNVFKLPKSLVCRWIKVVVRDNWGNKDFTQIMELAAYGEPDGPNPKQMPANGFFQTNFGFLQLKQNQSRVMGCYDKSAGRLNGETDGRIIRFQWEEKGIRSGPGMMVLSSDRRSLSGFWFEEGKQAGIWQGAAATDASQGKCQVPQSGKDSLARTLDLTGYAILYGVGFKNGTSELNADSDQTLEELLDVITKRQEAGFIIEGHYPSAEEEDANALSLRRAQSVMDWLISQGMEPERLSAEGYGKTRPEADDDTVEGRILNQRVEIHMTK
jgi:OmpA-OmpF porin, OOP family